MKLKLILGLCFVFGLLLIVLTSSTYVPPTYTNVTIVLDNEYTIQDYTNVTIVLGETEECWSQQGNVLYIPRGCTFEVKGGSYHI